MTAAERLLLGGAKLNLAASVPADASHLPELSVDVADLASVVPAHGYAPAGLSVLREAIAARHTGQGLETRAEQVHVTNGAQHALDLALGAVTRPGDTVAVEDPTYAGVRDLLVGRGLRALPLPLDLVDRGGGGGRLARMCRSGRVAAVLLVPAVHSPTGRVRRRAVVRDLATELDALGRPVIEDNTVADLVFTGRRPPSLAVWCTRAPVISVESTSKVGWGGLRVGWLRASADLVARTVVTRGRTDYGTSVASQLLALQLLERYDEVVAARQTALARAAKEFARLLHEQLAGWTFDAPGGGLSLWVDTGVDADALAGHALHHGVTVAPGSSAAVGEDARTRLRLCFDRPALELEAAVVRLRRADEDTRGRR
jgi:DNA-binding transcriptional MocR family regulator